MKVLHITNAYPTETYPSYGVFIKEQIESLQSSNIENSIIFINARDNGRAEYIKVIPQIIAKAKTCDIIHCHHAYSAFVTLFLARVKKPMIVSFLSTPEGEVSSNKLSGYFYRKLIGKVDAYIVKNDPNVESIFPGRAYYLPNGVNLSRFTEKNFHQAQQELGIERGVYVLFSASGGAGRKEKRFDIFQKVMDALNKKHNIPAKELLLVNVARTMVPWYFNASSVHLLTSDYEGSPNSVKEALACNVPVVSTDVGNVKEVIGDIPGCYVSKTNDPDELAELVIKSINFHRVAGREAIVRKGLSMDTVAEKLTSIYQKVIQGYQ